MPPKCAMYKQIIISATAVFNAPTTAASTAVFNAPTTAPTNAVFNAPTPAFKILFREFFDAGFAILMRGFEMRLAAPLVRG
jgi:hypothetical protein